jgi:putative ABC transport system permease protein
MLTNYLKLTIRFLRSNKGYFFINLLGLTIGIASFILIVLWIKTETSFDKFHSDAANIYRVDYLLYEEGILEQHSASGSGAVGREMKNAFPEVKDYTRFSRAEGLVRYGDQIFKEKKILYAQSSFFNVFSFPLLKGIADSSLLAINNAVITGRTARKYFGDEDPVGKMIKIDGVTDYMVTGVAADPPGNSHIEFDILLSYENLVKQSRSWDNSWVSERVYTYVMLDRGTNHLSLQAKLPPMVESFIGTFMKEAFFLLEFRLVRLTDIHLHSSLNNEIKVNGNFRSVVTLGIVALLVLIIAFINYINLATSRSLERAHEVGIRKVSGAVKADLVFQFLTESALLNLLALAISLASVVILLPFFSQMMASPLKMDYFFGGILFTVLLFTGTLLTGLLPAIYISRFSPGLVLKGKNPTASTWISRLKNFLVVFQFAISVILIISTIMIFRQVSFLRNHDTGFRKEGLLVIEGPRILNVNSREALMTGFDSFRNDVTALPMVKSITSTSVIPGREVGLSRVFGVPVDGRNTEKRIDVYNIDDRFFGTYELKLLAGDDFARSVQEDAGKVILNESALAYYGFSDPQSTVGKILRGGKQEVTIKAVINDFNQKSLREMPRPLAFFNQMSVAFFSIKTDMSDVNRLVTSLERIWNEHYPGNPFNYFFLKDFYDEQYGADKRFSSLFLVSSLLAVIIACLGLSGLSSYAISRRTKEIGIRKSNGARTIQVMFLLNRDFLKWVVYAIIIAIPFAWWVMDNWLENYAYKTSMSWWIFLLAGVLALVTALLTVSWQSYKASSGNPVEALRYE